MDYYLIISGEDGIPLGTQSFGFFYAEQGMDMLYALAEKKPELIKFINIITDKGATLTVEEFLSLFSGEGALQMRRLT